MTLPLLPFSISFTRIHSERITSSYRTYPHWCIQLDISAKNLLNIILFLSLFYHKCRRLFFFIFLYFFFIFVLRIIKINCFTVCTIWILAFLLLLVYLVKKTVLESMIGIRIPNDMLSANLLQSSYFFMTINEKARRRSGAPCSVSKKYNYRERVSFRGAQRRGNPFPKCLILHKLRKNCFFRERIATHLRWSRCHPKLNDIGAVK